MVGLFNIGLGPGRTSTHPGDLTSLGAPYWLGAVVKNKTVDLRIKTKEEMLHLIFLTLMSCLMSC